MEPKNIFVTGPPRCGKSTLIEKVVGKIQKPMTGFFTRELTKENKRVGFSITTMDGKEGVLAYQHIRSPYRVGKYGVKLDHIDQIAVPSMIPSKPEEIIVIDEIGKMECFSLLFRQTLIKILDSEHPIIASVAQKGDRFIQGIKEREDILLLELSEKNRDDMVYFLNGTIDGIRRKA